MTESFSEWMNQHEAPPYVPEREVPPTYEELADQLEAVSFYAKDGGFLLSVVSASVIATRLYDSLPVGMEYSDVGVVVVGIANFAVGVAVMCSGRKGASMHRQVKAAENSKHS